jgi:hypothetical protein
MSDYTSTARVSGLRRTIAATSLTVIALLAAGPVSAIQVNATKAASPQVSATESTVRTAAAGAARVPTDRHNPSSRGLPKAGGPAASQRYARAYIAQRYGWGAGQYSCLKVMWMKESAWKYWGSNPNGKYHGIPQTSVHEWSKDGYSTSQYMHDPAVQIRVGARYIKSRYGSPCAAWSFWRNHHWY